MHPSYYTGAHACLLCFDMTRKVTYKNLDAWYDSLLACRGPRVPVVVVANKVDMEPARARTSFAFVERRRAERRAARRRTAADAGAATDDDDDDDDDDRDRDRDHGDEDMPLFLCSASDGTNVVAAFRDAIKRAAAFKDGGEVGAAFVDEVLSFIREEEASADGLFARDCQRAAAASYASGLDSLDKRFDSSNFSLGDDQSTLRDSHAGSQSLFSQASITRSLESTSNNNVCDSESEDEVQKQKSLARVLELRKANLVVQ
ncbi:Rab-like protein 2A [Entophlyctis luteolus]|nr:Rab-like protein 2A [Entophlyctis luteolus]